jgi:PhnB protein
VSSAGDDYRLASSSNQAKNPLPGGTGGGNHRKGAETMSRVTTYLNFMGDTEEAVRFYGSVFGTEITGEIVRIGSMPSGPDSPELSEADKNLVGHVEIPILAGHVLMGTDLVESMGHQLQIGNNVTINLEPDTRGETDRLYAALSDGGRDSTGMLDVPWGYWGCTLDRFGVRWMFNCYEPKS